MDFKLSPFWTRFSLPVVRFPEQWAILPASSLNQLGTASQHEKASSQQVLEPHGYFQGEWQLQLSST